MCGKLWGITNDTKKGGLPGTELDLYVLCYCSYQPCKKYEKPQMGKMKLIPKHFC